MKICHLFIISFIILCSTANLFAQNSVKENSTKKKQQSPYELRAIEEILRETVKLKFPQDRAYILSFVGAYFCKNDNKIRAERIFAESVRELFVAQIKAKPTDGDIYESIQYGNFPRSSILQNISGCDAELGYKYLIESRPPKILETLNSDNQTQNSIKENTFASNSLNYELNQEAFLKRDIAEKNPERLVEFLNQDITSYLTPTTLDMLKQLSTINSVLANELTEKAIAKLLQLKFYNKETKKPVRTGYFYNAMIANSFFLALIEEPRYRQPQLSVSSETLTKLAEKLGSVLIDGGPDWFPDYILKKIQIYSPETFQQIEKIKEERKQSPDYLESQRYRELTKSDISINEFIASADNFSQSNKDKIYKIAACRLVRNKKFEDAINLFQEKYKNNALGQYQLNLIFQSNAFVYLSTEDFESAFELGKQTPNPYSKAEIQAFLIERFYLKNPTQNRQKTIQLLDESVKDFESDSTLKNKSYVLGKFLRVYALVDPVKTFTLFDSLVADANKTSNTEPTLFSEFKITENGSYTNKSEVIFNSSQTIKRLSEKDFAKTLMLINKLKRIESRILVKLNLIKPIDSNEFGLRFYGSFDAVRFCQS